MRIRNFLAAALLAAAPWGALPASPSPDEARLGPMAAALHNRIGTWRVKAELRFTPDARPLVIDAVAENRLVGGRWLVSELRSADGMNGFEGIGVNGYDPAQGKYVGYWIDGSRAQLVPVEGSWDARAGIFRTVSVERRRDGSAVAVSSETRAVGRDMEIVRFTAPDERGRPFVRMILTYRRGSDGQP